MWMKATRFTDPLPKDDILDRRMILVSLNSCIACLVVLSSSTSLFCRPANRVVQKITVDDKNKLGRTRLKLVVCPKSW